MDSWWGTSTLLTPIVFTFSDPIGSHFYIQLNLIHPLFLQKKSGLSLSHLVPEKIWHKVGLFFTNICHLTLLKQFVRIFSLIFDLVNPLFTVIRSFWPPHFYKTLDAVGSIFSSPAGPSNQTFGEVPPQVSCTETYLIPIYHISKCSKGPSKNVNIFMSVQTVHFFKPPPPSPLSVQTNIFGFQNMGFTHNIYCAATKINPYFMPVWYVTSDRFG